MGWVQGPARTLGQGHTRPWDGWTRPWRWRWAEDRPGRGPVGGPSSAVPMAGQGRAVGSWRPALLWHWWDRGWQPQGTDVGSWTMGRGSPGAPKSLTVVLVNNFSESHFFSLLCLHSFIILNLWTKSKDFLLHFMQCLHFFSFHNDCASEKISIH